MDRPSAKPIKPMKPANTAHATGLAEASGTGGTQAHAGHMAAPLMRALAAVLAMMVATMLAWVLPSSAAAQGTQTANSDTTNADSNTNGITQPEDGANANTSAVSVSIDAMSAIITPSSGVHLQATITNDTDATLPAGTLRLMTNTMHAFVSRTDIQEWAQGTAPIPTPDELGATNVATVPAHERRTVSITVPSDSDALQAMTTWGPRPAAVEYEPNADELDEQNAALLALAGVPNNGAVRATTFLTRSQDGVVSANTPKLDLTVAMPVTTNAWTLDSTALKSLIATPARATNATATNNANNTNSGPNGIDSTGSMANSSTPSASAPSTSLATLTDEAAQQIRAKNQLSAKYPQLQLVSDPQVFSLLRTPHASALMQPANFDITAFAAVNDSSLYKQAGIAMSAWHADTATRAYRQVMGDEQAQRPVVAWQGNANWTLAALNTARQQGYGMVIATHDFDMEDSSTVHTSIYDVPTDAGSVKVLAAQSVLSRLASGHATSPQASAERTTAGRVARFAAQSAFYQMEQPYLHRHLLAAMDASTTADEAGALMAALAHASWLNLTDLTSLAAVEPTASADEAAALAPQDPGLDCATVTTALSQLGYSRKRIQHFLDTIMQSGSSPSAGASSDDHDDSSPSPTTDSTAGSSTNETTGVQAWGRSLLNAHDGLALLAMSPAAKQRTTLTQAGQQLADALYAAVSISSSDSLMVVSETASLPVTVSNALPYAVHVRISSITDSMELVTSRFAEVNVLPKSEAQVTFTVRASTTGTAIAKVQLLGMDGLPFGAAHTTTITSALRLSDKSGIAFVAVAVLLGVVGLWRQFHRKKDGDQ
ncbi:hypothetical protein BGLCM_0143 [Bifidobacterium gallicum DSM 20093 = LMG 11596]|uniref:Uncharacterized protein n=1 Tax=Bifidobacterium gallicum DSM 20093 = LMG 11596 TaxID=561180 RepID=A0A087AMX2_9BIFI|nr:hypothetical protein BGLCM_0143 [Bifidobacterium gallicum DSM 20093 = LMG 11596]